MVMPLYECDEYQFVENIRRLIETSEKFLVNRKIVLHDDAKYGPAILPDSEFKEYTKICFRKSLKSTVFSIVPFIDDFHKRMHEEGEVLHSSSNLMYPRMSIPYYRVEYSVNVWGGTYFFSFDALFNPQIVIEKRNIKDRPKGNLVHVIRYNPPNERLITISLPNNVMVFDIKNMIRVIDHSSNF
jgi:hypothetical protein